MNDQAEQHRVSAMQVDELSVVGLFAEMEVRCDRVLEEMNDQISEEHQKGSGFSPHLDALRNHLDQSGGQHEPGAQGHEVTKIASLPMPLHDDRTAKDIGRSGGEAEKYAGENRVHWWAAG